MCDCCAPTHGSPDPVVVRLEREVDELKAQLDAAGDGDTWKAACKRLEAEVERLDGDYAKLYGVVREYIACEKHPQIRGEAYRDLRCTYDVLSGADADQGWPACYQRSQESLFKAQRELDDALADNANLRGLLREACECGGVVSGCYALSAGMRKRIQALLEAAKGGME